MLSLGLPLLFIALGGIGLPGGAVYVRTGWMTPRQRTQVSLAGPLANVVLAVLLLAAVSLFYDPAHRCSGPASAFLGFLQVTARAAEPAADSRPGRLRRAGTAPQAGDPARAGTGQGAGVS